MLCLRGFCASGDWVAQNLRSSLPADGPGEARSFWHSKCYPDWHALTGLKRKKQFVLIRVNSWTDLEVVETMMIKSEVDMGISSSNLQPHSPQPTARSLSRKPFSLLEILVVTGVAVMVMLMALPAFEKLAYGGGMNVAASMLTTKLKLARQLAVSENEYIGIAFPVSGWPAQARFDKNSSDSQNKNIPANYFHQAFRVFRASPAGGGLKSQLVSQAGAWSGWVTGPVFMGWLPGEKWEFLPKGVVIAGVDDDTSNDTDMTVNKTAMTIGTANAYLNNLNEYDIIWTNGKASIQDITMLTDAADNYSNVYFASIVFTPSGSVLNAVSRTEDAMYINLKHGRFLDTPVGDLRSMSTGAISASDSNPAGFLVLDKDSDGVALPGVNLRIDNYTGSVRINE